MTIKVILAPVTGEKAETIALDAGLRLARRLDAHLRAVHIRRNARDKSAMPKDLINALSDKALKQVMAETEAKELGRSVLAHKMFDAFCAEQGVVKTKRPRKSGGPSAEWGETLGDPHHVISIVGRLADLIVICRPNHGVDQWTGRFIQAALFDTGSPMLLTPRIPVKSIATRIAIAWDRSTTAKRAVVAALPLLTAAKAVEIVSVGEPRKTGPSGRELAAYLKWHGIKAGVTAERIIKVPPQEALMDACRAFKADLVVMGAYTRSRLSERVFGGVTQSMLNIKDIPVLFQA